MKLLDRISPRHVFETRIQIGVKRDGKTLNLPGWARNLSESGLGAFVAEALTLGEHVTLEIPMANSEAQAIPSTVIRTRGTEYGFRFTALSAEQRQHIRTTLQGHPLIPNSSVES